MDYRNGKENAMRVLILGVYEYPSWLNADSNYTTMRTIVEGMLNASPDVHIYWVLPDHTEEMRKCTEKRWKFLDDFEHPRLTKILTPTYTNRSLNEWMFSDELFKEINPWNGAVPTWDFVICTVASKAGRVQELLGFMGKGAPKVCLWDFGTKSIYDHEIPNISEANMALNMVAYATVEICVFYTKTHLKEAMNTASMYLSGKMCKQLHDRVVTYPVALNKDGLDAIKVKLAGKKNKKMSVYFGGRFTASKGGEVAVGSYDQLIKTAVDVEAHVTVPAFGNVRVSATMKKSSDKIHWYEHLTQTQAWEVMQQCHVSVYPQEIRMLPAALFEQIYSGLVVIVNGNNTGDNLPAEYPFFYKDELECWSLLKWVTKNYDKAQTMMEPMRKWIIEHNSSDTLVTKFVDRLTEIQTEELRLLRDKKFESLDVYKGLAGFCKERGAQSWEDVKAVVREIKSSYLMVDSIGINSPKKESWNLCYRNLLAFGDDDVTHKLPFFNWK